MSSELHSVMVLNNSTLLEFVTRIAQQMQQPRSLSAILQSVAADVRHVLNLKHVKIYQLQENGKFVTIAEAIALNDGVVHYSQADYKVTANHDASNHDSLDSKLPHTLIASELTPTFIEFPIMFEQTSWGLITAHSDNQLSSDEYVSIQHLLEYIAAQVAIAIQQDHSRQQCSNQQTRFQTLAAALPGVFCQCLQQSDGSLQLQTINVESLESLGFGAEDIHLDFEVWLNSIHSDDRPAFDHSLHEAVQTLQQWSWKGRIRCLSGEWRWLHIIACPEQQHDEMLWYALLIDITETQQNLVKTQQTQQVLHHAMEAWGSSEAKYQALVEENPAVTYIAATDQTFPTLYISPQIEDMLGYSYSDWQTNACLWADCLHPDDRGRVLAELAGQVSSANAYVQEYRMITHTGESIWIQDHAVVMSAQDGQSKFIQGTMLDITERKTLEDTLRFQANQERLMSSMIQRIRQSLQLNDILQTAVEEVQRFLDTDRVVIFKFEPDQQAIAIAESVGHPDQSIKGRQIEEAHLIAMLDNCHLTDQILQCETPQPAFCSSDYPDRFSHERVFANTSIPIFQDGKIWGMLAAHHLSECRQWSPMEMDSLQHIAGQLAIAIHQSELYHQVKYLKEGLEHEVAERTAQLREMLNFEASLKRITDKVRDSLDEHHIMHATIREIVQTINAFRCDIATYDFEQNIVAIVYEYSNSCFNSFPNKSGCLADFSDVLPQLLAGECIQFCELYSRPIQPDWIRTAVLACPIMDDQGTFGDLWLFRPTHEDFSEQEIKLVQQVASQCAIAIRQSRLYQEAQAQVRELARLNHLKDDFLSTVSHELRTPISSIKMAIQMLDIILREERFLEDESGRVAHYFQILRDECQRETNLINDLLDLSRIDSETEPLMLSALKLQDWMPHVAFVFEEQALQHDRHLHIQIAPDLPPLVTDYGYLERILTELLHNACKYTPAGEQIIVSARVNHHASSESQASGAFYIEVCNSGVEISPDECDRVFDKFYRIPNSDPWKHGGTGLGLALTKKLTEYLHGSIQLTSNQGWTCFTVCLSSLSRETAHRSAMFLSDLDPSAVPRIGVAES
ncbi:MAG: GAF domain-containing protein [Elainellaceae cyanobacterium]